MAVTAQSIIDKVRVQLIDTGTTQRWTDAELLYWVSDGQRAIVAALPQASYKVTTVSLAAGTRQSLPADGYKLLDVTRNLTSGGVAGAPCTSIERTILDRQYPTWHSANASASVLHWTYDQNDPTAFFVYPRNTGTGSVEVVYSFMPTDITSTSSNISVRDIYQTPLIDYVLYRAHSKDSDFAAGQQLAAGYLQAFTAFLQAQSGGQK
jgi:hypothetical protein